MTGEPVPGAVDVLDRRGRIVSMWAPELAPELLLDTAGAAAYVGLRESTFAAYLSNSRRRVAGGEDLRRGDLPLPPVTIGPCGGWTRPVLDIWNRHQLRWDNARQGS